MRVLAVLNSRSGRAGRGEVREALLRSLVAGGHGYVFWELDGGAQGDPRQLLRAALSRGYDMVVAAGGDGTISLVADALAGSETPMAIVPVGTANVLANELGIPLDLSAACALLAGDHDTRSLDGMRVGDQTFVLQIEAGIGSMMIRDTPQEAKSQFGRVAYLWTALQALIGSQPGRFMLTVDGERHRLSAADVLLANGGTLGVAPFRWGPDIEPDDGVIDVCVVSGRTLKDYLGIIWHALTGQQRRSRGLRYFQARERITVNAKRRLPIQADGEIIGYTPLQVQVVPAAVRVVVPVAAPQPEAPADDAASPPAPTGEPISPAARAEAAPVEAALKGQLREIKTPAQASQVAETLIARAGELTEQDVRASVGGSPDPARAVQREAEESGEKAVADTLIAAAQQVAASTGDRRAALEDATQRATNPGQHAEIEPDLVGPLSLLREELLGRMKPWNALDARVFLALNHLPHTQLSNQLMYAVTVVMNGGWGWVAGLLGAAYLRGGPGVRVLRDVTPPLWFATMAVEYPIKAFFRRKRPFIDIVRAISVGRRPGSYSFPSGHSAAAFAGAWLITRHHPRLAPLWYAIAGLVGFSRIYLGAHYPGDVLSGALVGTALAEATRRTIAVCEV